MLNVHIIVCYLIASSIVQAAHFRGGCISWQAMSPNTTNATTITINLQQTYSWTYASNPCGPLVGTAGSLNCISSSCSNYVSSMTQIQAPCISYDISLGVSTGQSITPLTLLTGSQLILSYQSNAWLPLVSSTGSPWSLITYIDLAVRSDNGRINSSPTSAMSAVVTILVNVQQILRIPMMDVDFDIVKCRWANQSSLIGTTLVNECQGGCFNIPGAQLDTSSSTDNNCSLVFTTAVVGYYVVALQIEDFMPSAPNGPALSSIPLQFVIHTVNISCNQPSIIGQMTNGDTVQVEANEAFSVSIIAQAGCNTTTINRFSSIILPSATANTSAVTSLGSMLYSIEFIWTPTDDQIGTTQLFCTVALDDNNLQSPDYCLNFIVIAITTSTVLSTSSDITSLSTITPSTSSTSDQSLNLGLILGLGIPLLLLAGILASCIACRWCPGQFWKKLRQRFWREKDAPCQQCQSKYPHDVSMHNRKVVDAPSAQYRQQYIKAPMPSSQSSYIDSFFPDRSSPFDSSSMATMRTTLTSPSFLNSTLPSVETPTQISSPLQSPHPMQGGSILIQAYSQQETRANFVF